MASPNDQGPRDGKRGAPRGGAGKPRADAGPKRGGTGTPRPAGGTRGGAGKARSDGDSPRRGSGTPRPASPRTASPRPASPRSASSRAEPEAPLPVTGGGVVVRVSRILDAPASAVFRALNDPARRGWSPEPLYRVVSALAPRFVRLALPDGSQVSVGITRQGNVRCSVAVEQSGLPASVSANVARDRWMGALAALAEQLDAEWD